VKSEEITIEREQTDVYVGGEKPQRGKPWYLMADTSPMSQHSSGMRMLH